MGAPQSVAACGAEQTGDWRLSTLSRCRTRRFCCLLNGKRKVPLMKAGGCFAQSCCARSAPAGTPQPTAMIGIVIITLAYASVLVDSFARERLKERFSTRKFVQSVFGTRHIGPMISKGWQTDHVLALIRDDLEGLHLIAVNLDEWTAGNVPSIMRCTGNMPDVHGEFITRNLGPGVPFRDFELWERTLYGLAMRHLRAICLCAGTGKRTKRNNSTTLV
ncbi:hypothetical protein CERZMDRAFT_96896 [Cercospora zeae-maydis SCOH1-5]|uniref:Uncharacterized protein n=1 Tax=Cercospora zeae-maydis SCOH1-5 TaxID=717836 RepID=A0A6A6FIK0_9PEZI|nr:hypothetical protein CERZMDRAFT_96896 [Cercospora zeae-maydis SCOH1-5]